ncbi:hypothetical protein C8Q74DRAFT_775964 [Fomes fomentarius]|nr:hypothetical protein C8Q74DRAFT_775964 [Fomes fomentarius]
MTLLTANQGFRGLTIAVISEWATTVTLIFGGLLQQRTDSGTTYARAPIFGVYYTFAQFILISLHGLPTFVISFRWHGLPLPRLRKRRLPLAPYLVQVALSYAISLLNNMAFAYKRCRCTSIPEQRFSGQHDHGVGRSRGKDRQVAGSSIAYPYPFSFHRGQ